MNVHYMSETNEWATPQGLFDRLNKEFSFTLDPCANEHNHKCEKYFTKENDGLSLSWMGERVFVNPPYGRKIKHWVEKSHNSKAALVVMLIPARTDTRYWHDHIMQANEIRFIKGRVHFSDSKQSAPFPSAIVVFSGGLPTTIANDTANALAKSSVPRVSSFIQNKR